MVHVPRGPLALQLLPAALPQGPQAAPDVLLLAQLLKVVHLLCAGHCYDPYFQIRVVGGGDKLDLNAVSPLGCPYWPPCVGSCAQGQLEGSPVVPRAGTRVGRTLPHPPPSPPPSPLPLHTGLRTARVGFLPRASEPVLSCSDGLGCAAALSPCQTLSPLLALTPQHFPPHF